MKQKRKGEKKVQNKKKARPLVTVIITTYRRDECLRYAVASAWKQTYENIEIIVVDDNADTVWNRRVEKIIREFSSNKNVIYIKNEENKGSAASRNIGIQYAKGEYITFLDDDDLYMPDKVKNQLVSMLKIKADYSITDLRLYDEKHRFVEKRNRAYIKAGDKKSLMQYHYMYHMAGTDTFMFRKEYLLKIGGFPPGDVGDDFYVMERAIKGNGRFCYIPASDVKAVIHTQTDGLSSGESKIQGENRLYQYKSRRFSDFDKKTVRYINMRHYAILAFVELRRKNAGAFAFYAGKSFFSSPTGATKTFLQHAASVVTCLEKRT